MWDSYGFVSLLIGIIAATISAVIAVKWMVSYLNRKGLGIFGYYRIWVGLVVGVLILLNVGGLGDL